MKNCKEHFSHSDVYNPFNLQLVVYLSLNRGLVRGGLELEEVVESSELVLRCVGVGLAVAPSTVFAGHDPVLGRSTRINVT